MASNKLLNMTNPRRLEEFRNHMMRTRNSAAAHAVTQAAFLELELSSLRERTAAAVREHRTQVRRLHRMQAGGHASASAAPAAPQAEASSSKKKKGGQGVRKKCGACGLHKSKETGHTRPLAQHTASAAEQNGRIQSRRQAAHVNSSQSSWKVQPSPGPEVGKG